MPFKTKNIFHVEGMEKVKGELAAAIFSAGVRKPICTSKLTSSATQASLLQRASHTSHTHPTCMQTGRRSCLATCAVFIKKQMAVEALLLVGHVQPREQVVFVAKDPDPDGQELPIQCVHVSGFGIDVFGLHMGSLRRLCLELTIVARVEPSRSCFAHRSCALMRAHARACQRVRRYYQLFL